MLGGQNQAFQSRLLGAARHAQERRGDCGEVAGVKRILRHAGCRIYGEGVGDFGFDVGNERTRDLGVAEFQLGDGLPPETREVWSVIRLRGYPLDDMTTAAAFLEEEPLPLLDFRGVGAPRLGTSLNRLGSVSFSSIYRVTVNKSWSDHW